MKRWGLLLVLLTFVGCDLTLCAPFPEPDDNVAPTARLVWPQLWDVDNPVVFDGTQTDDVDGPVFSYEMTFGDGTEVRTSDDGRFEHSYAAAGNYAFVFIARDEHGAKAEIQGSVTLVDNLDEPACTCDLPCFDPAVCSLEGCLLGEVSAADTDGGSGADDVVIDAINCGEPEPEAEPDVQPTSDAGP